MTKNLKKKNSLLVAHSFYIKVYKMYFVVHGQPLLMNKIYIRYFIVVYTDIIILQRQRSKKGNICSHAQKEL